MNRFKCMSSVMYFVLVASTAVGQPARPAYKQINDIPYYEVSPSAATTTAPAKIFISGSSAGGYLAAMVGMDGEWLKRFGCSNRQLAGIIAMSGQMTTHFQIKNERKMPADKTVIDRFAPIFHVGKDLPPILLVVGDRRFDWPARTEESLLLAALLRRVAGHSATEIYELQGYDHGMTCDAFAPVLNFVKCRTSAPARK